MIEVIAATTVALVAVMAMSTVAVSAGEFTPPDGCHKHEFNQEVTTYVAHEAGEHTFKGGNVDHGGYLVTVLLEAGETWTSPNKAISHVIVCPSPTTPSSTTTTAPPTSSTTTPPETTTSVSPPTTTLPPPPETTTTAPPSTTTTAPTASTTTTSPPCDGESCTELPYTGSPIETAFFVGLAALIAGTALLWMARRRAH